MQEEVSKEEDESTIIKVDLLIKQNQESIKSMKQNQERGVSRTSQAVTFNNMNGDYFIEHAASMSSMLGSECNYHSNILDENNFERTQQIRVSDISSVPKIFDTQFQSSSYDNSSKEGSKCSYQIKE